MPFFELSSDKVGFPPGHFADMEGLLAEGGDVTADWLKAAYKGGIFLWFSPIEALRWWSPDPRIVLFENELVVDDDLQKLLDSKPYNITYNQDLNALITFCEKEFNQGAMNPNWLTGVFAKAFKELSLTENVQSVEIWEDNQLIGGVFGVVVGKLFLGEYVAGTKDGVKEIALISIVEKLKKEGIVLFDLTKETMASGDVGYREVSRTEFMNFLN